MAYLKACLVRMLVRLRAARGCARPDTEKTSIASRPLRADTTAERRHRTGYRMQQGFRDPPPTPATQTDRQAGRGGRAERRAKNSGVSGTRIKPEPTATTTRTRGAGAATEERRASLRRRRQARREPSQTRNAPKVTAEACHASRVILQLPNCKDVSIEFAANPIH